MMRTHDQVTLLRRVRLLCEWNYHLVVSVEALRKLAYETGQGAKLAGIEESVSKETAKTQADSLRLIDDIIRRLEVI